MARTQPASTAQQPSRRKKRKKKKKTGKSAAGTGRVREKAVVLLSCQESTSYRNSLVRAREKISLQEIGVESFKVRRRAIDAFNFELSGADFKAKSAQFAKAIVVADELNGHLESSDAF
ncbi:hypothetical protein M0802_010658 [Mischocyttarus mexicanus]|nr:hypothetical protein M0802_010658 [Mischocyttarus mexicanus]